MTSKVSVRCLLNVVDLIRFIKCQSVKLTPDAEAELLKMILMHIGPAASRRVVDKLISDGKISLEENFEVEAILDHLVEKGVDFYLIKWDGWSHEFNTWEPKTNLLDCQEVMDEFHRLKEEIGIQRSKEEIFAHAESKKKKIRELYEHIKKYNSSITALNILDAWIGGVGKMMPKTMGRPKSYTTKSAKTSAVKTFVGDLTNKRSKAYQQRKQEMERALKAWEKQLNEINTDPAGISVVNDVDFEGPPQKFVYINDYMPGEGVTIDVEPIIGCECENCIGEKNACCSANAGTDFAYYANRRLRLAPGYPIYECNKRCKCGPDCPNRVVQNGRKHKVGIFRTSNGRGWGVKAMQPIKKGSFVMEYVGEVITNEEAERRGKDYDEEGMTYLFDLDYQDQHSVYTVDAGVYGNVSHFVNHSCDPNLAVYVVWINNLDPRLPRIALFTTRDVKKGEELTFDYLMTGDTTEDSVVNVPSCTVTSSSVADDILETDRTMEDQDQPASKKLKMTSDCDIVSEGDVHLSDTLLCAPLTSISFNNSVAAGDHTQDIDVDAKENMSPNIISEVGDTEVAIRKRGMKIDSALPSDESLFSFTAHVTKTLSNDVSVKKSLALIDSVATSQLLTPAEENETPQVLTPDNSILSERISKTTMTSLYGNSIADIMSDTVSVADTTSSMFDRDSSVNGDLSAVGMPDGTVFNQPPKAVNKRKKFRLMCQCGAKNCRKYLY